MIEKTPEERAKEVGACVSIDRERSAVEHCAREQIRAAVAANTERCAKVEPMTVRCNFCQAKPGEMCWNPGERDVEGKRGPCGGTHRTRFAAAIRCTGEGEE